MTYVARTALAVLLVVPTVAASQVRDDAPSLDGTWKLKSVHVGGKKEEPPAEVFDKARLIFKGKSLTIKSGPDGDMETTFEVDNTKKPAHITIHPPKGEKNQLVGIYKIENDKLTICGTDKGERPTEFVSKEGTEIGLMVLERVKENKE
jgi:uncharacterized protein (TIGR03067 family)